MAPPFDVSFCSSCGLPLLVMWSIYPRGQAGVGLLILRITACTLGLSLIRFEFRTFYDSILAVPLAFVLIGLFSRVSSGSAAFFALGLLLHSHHDPAKSVALFVALCASLALTGPGGLSLDSALYGQHRIILPPRQ